MPPLDFPGPPLTVGQIYSDWQWDGAKWVSAEAGSSVTIGATPPTSPAPAAGNLWWDDVGGQMYIYYSDPNGNQWVAVSNQPGGAGPPGPQGPASNVIISDTPPANPVAGQLWWDSTVGQFFIWFVDPNGGQWVVASQQGAAGQNWQVGSGLALNPATSPPTIAMASPIPTSIPKAGVIDGSNAAAGNVGEYLTVTPASISLTSNVVANAASLTLSPGDWDCGGWINFTAAAGASPTILQGSLSTTSATETGNMSYVVLSSSGFGGYMGFPLGTIRFNVSVSTTIYNVAQALFASGTMTVQGAIWARRAR
jgi:hypothetical protein